MIEKYQNDFKLLIIAFLVINLLLEIYVAFIKPDVYALETLKAGGRENMKMAIQFYKSDVYVQQQKAALEQLLKNINNK